VNGQSATKVGMAGIGRTTVINQHGDAGSVESIGGGLGGLGAGAGAV
jgi:hypothetical protein